MFDAASRLFEESVEPILILGTDDPSLPPETILDAAHTLEIHDASVIGSDDGGYVGLGLRGPHQALFRNITWSTDRLPRDAGEGIGGRALPL